MDAPSSPSPAPILAGASPHHRGAGGRCAELGSGLSHCGGLGRSRVVPLLAVSLVHGHPMIEGGGGSGGCSIAMTRGRRCTRFPRWLRGKCTGQRGKHLGKASGGEVGEEELQEGGGMDSPVGKNCAGPGPLASGQGEAWIVLKSGKDSGPGPALN